MLGNLKNIRDKPHECSVQIYLSTNFVGVNCLWSSVESNTVQVDLYY